MHPTEEALPGEVCPGCGNDEPEQLRTCPRCESKKCEFCDAGDDVERPCCEAD